MRKLVTTFIQYPFYSNMIIFVLIVGGLFGLFNMKKSFFPETKTRTIFISVAYPGASPKEMEEGVTIRIEEAIRGIVGIKEFSSTSSENFARVVITTTGRHDIDVILQEVKNAVDGISSFPVSAERPIVYKRRNVTWAFYLGLSGEVDLVTLKKYSDDIEDDMRSSGIISQVNISGYPDLEISVEVSEETLLRYNLTFNEIEHAIAMNNSDISAGMIRSEDEEVLIRSRRRSVDPDNISDIIVKALPNGDIIRIRDLGTVKLKFSDVASRSVMNGKPAVSFFVNKLVDEDLKEISVYCNDYIEQFNKEHEGVELVSTYDFLDMLRGRLNLLYKNGGAGLLLVLICLGFFLSLRLSFWVAFGIPASFLGMFIVASAYGITINMISLFGMILVIGILVDDGIVIAENIYSHFEKGKSPKQAAIDGSLEVLPAVLTSVTTTMVAFSPLLIIKEGGMQFMFEMAFVVVFSLFFSLIEAFLVLPGHVGRKYILRPKDSGGFGMQIRNQLDVIVNYLRMRIYAPILRWSIKWRWFVITIPVPIIIITGALFATGYIKATFFPTIHFDAFNVNLAFTPGSGEKQTWNYLMKIDSVVWEVNKELMEENKEWMEKRNDTIPFIRYSFPNIGYAFDGVEVGAHAGNIFVLLRDLDNTGISSYELAEKVRKRIGLLPEAEKFTVGADSRWGAPVSISLLGKNVEELEKAEAYLIDELNSMEELYNVTKTNASGKREIQLKLKPEAYYKGLNHATISQQIRQGFFGGQVQRLQKGKDELRVWVRYPKHDRENVGQLENMMIKTPQGDYPLSELADYKVVRGPVNINHFNMRREVRVDADLVDENMPVPPIIESINTNIIPHLRAHYPGVDIMFQGQQRHGREAGTEMLQFFLVAFIIMILLVMIHFRSVSQALIIMLMIPLAWIGASWGHGVRGIPVSMMSTWGMVALSGVIINDAVVFLSKFNLNLREGMKLRAAIFDAGISRFRPILLTTLTTSLGLFPLIMERSFQAQFLVPMAVALAYGVFIGTFFILLFFPALIMFLNDIRIAWKWLWTGEKVKHREEVEKAIIYQKRELEKIK